MMGLVATRAATTRCFSTHGWHSEVLARSAWRVPKGGIGPNFHGLVGPRVHVPALFGVQRLLGRHLASSDDVTRGSHCSRRSVLVPLTVGAGARAAIMATRSRGGIAPP